MTTQANADMNANNASNANNNLIQGKRKRSEYEGSADKSVNTSEDSQHKKQKIEEKIKSEHGESNLLTMSSSLSSSSSSSSSSSLNSAPAALAALPAVPAVPATPSLDGAVAAAATAVTAAPASASVSSSASSSASSSTSAAPALAPAPAPASASAPAPAPTSTPTTSIPTTPQAKHPNSMPLDQYMNNVYSSSVGKGADKWFGNKPSSSWEFTIDQKKNPDGSPAGPPQIITTVCGKRGNNTIRAPAARVFGTPILGPDGSLGDAKYAAKMKRPGTEHDLTKAEQNITFLYSTADKTHKAFNNWYMDLRRKLLEAITCTEVLMPLIKEKVTVIEQSEFPQKVQEQQALFDAKRAQAEQEADEKKRETLLSQINEEDARAAAKLIEWKTNALNALNVKLLTKEKLKQVFPFLPIQSPFGQIEGSKTEILFKTRASIYHDMKRWAKPETTIPKYIENNLKWLELYTDPKQLLKRRDFQVRDMRNQIIPLEHFKTHPLKSGDILSPVGKLKPYNVNNKQGFKFELLYVNFIAAGTGNKSVEELADEDDMIYSESNLGLDSGGDGAMPGIVDGFFFFNAGNFSSGGSGGDSGGGGGGNSSGNSSASSAGSVLSAGSAGSGNSSSYGHGHGHGRDGSSISTNLPSSNQIKTGLKEVS